MMAGHETAVVKRSVEYPANGPHSRFYFYAGQECVPMSALTGGCIGEIVIGHFLLQVVRGGGDGVLGKAVRTSDHLAGSVV